MPYPNYEDRPHFSANAPTGQAHIFELDGDIMRYFHEGLPRGGNELCDFITTLLHNLKDHPDALTNFFDPAVKTFKFLRYGVANMLPLAILRHEKTVVVSPNFQEDRTRNMPLTHTKCGYYEIPNGQDFIAWENVTTSTLSKVAPDAVWNTTWGAYSARSDPPVERCTYAGLDCTNALMGIYEDPSDLEVAKDIASKFGFRHLAFEAWKNGDGVVLVVETSKDEDED
jgi:hypothetical protein